MVSEHSDKDSSLVTGILYVYFQRGRVVVVSNSVSIIMRQSLFDWLFQPIRGKSLSKNKFTCENAVSQTQYGSWTLRVMGSWQRLLLSHKGML